MVVGLESFKEWFAEYTSQYVVIGGTACDLLLSREGVRFRATRDIDNKHGIYVTDMANALLNCISGI